MSKRIEVVHTASFLFYFVEITGAFMETIIFWRY